MLEEQDIKKIGEVVECGIQASEVRVVQAVGTMLEQNVLPLLDKLDGRLTRVEAEMVTKAYLDDNASSQWNRFLN